jgi:cation transport ATPase
MSEEMTFEEKNIKRFKRFRLSFQVFWVSLFLTFVLFSIGDSYPEGTGLFWVKELCLYSFAIAVIAGWTYLFTLGPLVAAARRSAFTWVLLVFLSHFLGIIISYWMMRGIAIEQGWDK